jgi:hypothetical protein
LKIANPQEKVVQKAMELTLHRVYNCVFLETSHGFRPNKSCHTALKSIDVKAKGVAWFIEADITKFFDRELSRSLEVRRLVEGHSCLWTFQVFTKFLESLPTRDKLIFLGQYSTSIIHCPKGGGAGALMELRKLSKDNPNRSFQGLIHVIAHPDTLVLAYELIKSKPGTDFLPTLSSIPGSHYHFLIGASIPANLCTKEIGCIFASISDFGLGPTQRKANPTCHCIIVFDNMRMIKINHTGEPSRFNKVTRRVPLEELSFNKFAPV